MNKDVALKLVEKANEIASNFSNKERQGNFNGEEFKVHKIMALGETSAAIIFDKLPSTKRALVYCYWVQKMNYWGYFFVSYGHLAGLNKLNELLAGIEEFNFEKNFDEIKAGALNE